MSKPTASSCKISVAGITVNKTELDQFIACEAAKYGPKSPFMDAVVKRAEQMGETMLNKAQTSISTDLSRVEGDIAKIEKFLSAFLKSALTDIKQEMPEIEKLAQGLEQQALRELSAWLDKEQDDLLHSLTPVLAWIVALLLFYQLYGGVFDKLPVAYRLAIATLVVISFPPKWRSKIDRVSVPVALGLFGLVLFKSEFKRYPWQML